MILFNPACLFIDYRQKPLDLSSARLRFSIKRGIPLGPATSAPLAGTRGNLIHLFQPQP